MLQRDLGLGGLRNLRGGPHPTEGFVDAVVHPAAQPLAARSKRSAPSVCSHCGDPLAVIGEYVAHPQPRGRQRLLEVDIVKDLRTEVLLRDQVIQPVHKGRREAAAAVVHDIP